MTLDELHELLDDSHGTVPLEDIYRRFHQARDDARAGRSAGPQGSLLWRYEDDPDEYRKAWPTVANGCPTKTVRMPGRGVGHRADADEDAFLHVRLLNHRHWGPAPRGTSRRAEWDISPSAMSRTGRRPEP